LSPESIFKLWKIARQFQPDLIHAHDSRTLGLAAILKLLGQEVKLVAARRVAFQIRKNIFWRLKYQRAVDRIITVSKFIREQLLKAGIGSDKVEVVYDGWTSDEVGSGEARSLARRSFGLTESEWVLGCIGQFTSEKGHEVLIRGVKKLRERCQKVRLVLVGDGPLRKRYERMIGELGLVSQVIFPGFVTDLNCLVPAFDLFVFPSLSEGLGSTLLMVMAHHVPVCASRVGGIPELVIEGETGSLFEPGDAQALADTVLKCTHDRALTQKMAETAYHRVKSEFSVERMVSETYKIYVNVLTG
jgi:L-malate glycosyltransferase